MLFRSFFDEKLAQYSYLIGCQRTGEAIVIDPARNIEPYFTAAKKEGLNLTAATETHIHADFVSGARELGVKHGVKLYLSDEGDENWKYQYLAEVKHQLLKHGDQFSIGNVDFKVIHTPGHTPESISFILTDRGGGADRPMGIFTGDFVFVGDVGRPDLLEKAAKIQGTTEQGAKEMYASLKAFKQLPDFLQVWPGHGAGSACGKSLGAVPMSTVGYEKQYNWALQEMPEETFIHELTDDQPEPPAYFAVMKKVNKEGPALVNQDPIPEITSFAELTEKLTNDQVIVLDSRAANEFARGHLEGTINITLNKSFPNWAGWLLDYDKALVVIAAPDVRNELKIALESVGLDHLIGFADVSLLNQADKLEQYETIEAEELKGKLDKDDVYLIDVRNQSEWESGHIEQAHHMMLGTLAERTDEIPTDKKVVVQCQSGVRSAIAASILQKHGIKNIANLKGGYANWKLKL